MSTILLPWVAWYPERTTPPFLLRYPKAITPLTRIIRVDDPSRIWFDKDMTQTDSAPKARDVLGQYHRDGFALFESVLDERQLADAREAVEWAMESVEGSYRWIKQRTYEWFGQWPIFLELIEHPFVIEFARGTLGEDFHMIAAQCSRNTKADPYAPGAMQIHQDACFFPPADRARPDVPADRYGFSAMWYLQDTPLEMGPTQLVAGSQLPGAAQHSEQELEAEPDKAWRCAIPAGSLLFFNHRTWHRGARNETETPRDLITNAYARPEVLKAQVTTKQADGSEKYVPWDDLLKECSPLRKMLMRPR